MREPRETTDGRFLRSKDKPETSENRVAQCRPSEALSHHPFTEGFRSPSFAIIAIITRTSEFRGGTHGA
jgi:hypothetical protein